MKKLLYLILGFTMLISCSNEEELIEATESNNIQQTLTGQSRLSERMTLEYAITSYSDGIANTGYNSSIFFYPKNKLEKLPVVIVMHGWMGSKEKMSWIGEELAKKGFAAIVISAINNKKIFTNPKDWIKNYEVAFESIKAENERTDSPLFNRLDVNKISMIGHSMGAGGALYFANQTSTKIQSIVALAPYSSERTKPGRNITSPTLILTGEYDFLAPPSIGMEFYDMLGNIPKGFCIIPKIGHNDFEKGGKSHDEIGAKIISWLVQYGM